jgi:hypothetical protein
MIVVIPDTVVIDSPRLAIVIAASARAEGAQVYCAIEHHQSEAHAMMRSDVDYIPRCDARCIGHAYWIEHHACDQGIG